MANNAAQDILDNIVSELSELSDLQQVIKGRSFTFSSGFPACTVFLAGIDNELLTNAPTYFRTYSYGIVVFQETTNKAKADAERDFNGAVDAILDKLGTEWTLNNNADSSLVEAGAAEIVDDAQGPMIALEITFSVKTIIS